MNKKKYLIAAIGIILVAVIAYLIFSPKNKDQSLLVKVKKGPFNITVVTTGELMANSSEPIYGPEKLRSLDVWTIRIQNIVPEGTKVKEGDYVATLDPKEINTYIKTAEDDYETAHSRLDEAQLDTAYNLKLLVDGIKDAEFDLEEAKIAVKQSIYETAATQEQVKNNLKKSEKRLDQAKIKYQLELKRSEGKMRTTNLQFNQRKKRLDDLKNCLDDLTIKAPKPGMVIYHRNPRTRAKNGIGATLETYWEFIVADIPDLSIMKSMTNVNEIDVSKVKVGQPVIVGIDAFPDKKLSGKVTQLANMGEEDQKSTTKLFEVTIILNETDSILRPGMTTKNTIVTGTYDNVLHIPMDAVFGNDSSGTWVYKKKGGGVVRQEVATGESDDNEILIRAGLTEDDYVYLSEPANGTKLPLVQLSDADRKKYGIADKLLKATKSADQKPDTTKNKKP
jgi:multidrug efflux pump subunit AcrA (membrane-fusion protein)